MIQEIAMAVLWVGIALAIGLLMTKLMKKIHFPNVTGFLIAGILLGPWVLGLIDQTTFNGIVERVSWISEIALGFIAFSIGGSFKVSALKKVGKKATIISVLEALGGAVVVIAGLLLGYFLGLKDFGLTIPMILILGAIACATAPAATLLVINQYKAHGPVTETLIPVVAFDDVVALISFSVLFAVAKSMQIGGDFNAVEAILIPCLQIVISLVLGAILGFIISFATRWFRSRTNRLILCILAVLIGVALSQLDFGNLWNLGVSFKLSSLLCVMAIGGIYVNFAKGISVTGEFLDKFTAPIFMLFFIISGAKLNFSIFSSSPIVFAFAGIYIVARVVGKWSGAALGGKVTKAEPVVQKYLGFTLVPQAGVALGLATSASTYSETEGPLILTIIILCTIIYELTGPLITKWALTSAGEIEKKAS